MTAPIFVDTNVLVYARVADAHAKQRRAAAWMEHLWRNRSGRLSFQVLQEFYVNVTRKLKRPVSREVARAEVRDLLAWRPIVADATVLDRAFAIEERYRLSFWDALIVAAAAAAGCSKILSEDLQEGQDFGGIVVANPFHIDPTL